MARKGWGTLTFSWTAALGRWEKRRPFDFAQDRQAAALQGRKNPHAKTVCGAPGEVLLEGVAKPQGSQKALALRYRFWRV